MSRHTTSSFVNGGVRVHYCAESFANDDTLPAMMMKSLKRVMAGEYSRELGVKVFDAQTRGAKLGFRQGALPGYGLRRLLLAPDKTPKQLMKRGERKSLATLVPGPDNEVRCVHMIYHMFLRKQMMFTEIARELNRKGIKFHDGALHFAAQRALSPDSVIHRLI